MDAYRKFMLFTKGLMYDSVNGYEAASKQFNDDDLSVDVTGHVFLITGANSGIGYVTAKQIAQRGGTVHMVCRNEERGNKARSAIIAETNNQNIHIHLLDLTSIRDVVDFTRRFCEANNQLDVLVNNAGEMVPELRRTERDDLDASFATNTMGPYMLTQGLLPLIRKSTRRPRVVTVTSAGMMLQKLNHRYFDDLTERNYDGTMAYAQCKRQVTVLTEYWASIYPEIHFSCMHPGWVDTPAAKRGLGEFYEKMKLKFRSPQEGADTVIWLCLSPVPLTKKSGEYYQDRKVARKHLPLSLTRESSSEHKDFIKYMENEENRFTQISPAA